MEEAWTTDECGCRWRMDSPKVRLVYPCRVHAVVPHFNFMHFGWPGHEECCDKAQMQRLVDEFGREDVEAGIAAVEDAEPRAYYRKVLGMVS